MIGFQLALSEVKLLSNQKVYILESNQFIKQLIPYRIKKYKNLSLLCRFIYVSLSKKLEQVSCSIHEAWHLMYACEFAYCFCAISVYNIRKKYDWLPIISEWGEAAF